MPSTLISVSWVGIERRFTLHSFSFLVLLIAMLAKKTIYVFFWALGENLYFNYVLLASSLL